MGVAAIVGSLIFIGFQMRQEQKIALAQIGQSSNDTNIEVSVLITENAETWVKSNAGEELSDEEILIVGRIVHSLYSKSRNEANMRRNMGQPGFVPLRMFAIFLLENPGARRLWLAMSEEEVMQFSQFSDNRYFARNREEVISALSKLENSESE